jgi:hypothetical protein
MGCPARLRYAVADSLERRQPVDIIVDFLKFGIIFGVLGTAPIVTWLAISWLATDRRRTSPRSNSG